jgi:spore coat protein A
MKLRRTPMILVLASAVAVFAATASFARQPLPGGTLDPNLIRKYVDPLPIPGVMASTPSPDPAFTGDYYEIAVRQFRQQVLSSVDVKGKPLPITTVWSYGTVKPLGSFHYPAFSIEARVNEPVRVKWINDLKDPVTGNFLPHLLPVDQTLHWANPPQTCAEGTPRTDCRGTDPNPYTGPVPIVVHLHGAHVNPDSDGYPEAWFLPAANNIPPGYATRGSNFGQIPGAPLEDGAALFQYRNDQRAATLWFHDHALGMTRSNVYAGPAGFYLLRGGSDDLPSGEAGQLPGGAYEIPLAIQDRSFNADGSLFFAGSRAFFDGFQGPYVDDSVYPSDISPIWNPEFFGNTIVVNGKTWPYLNVEPRKYRFRILNGSDTRFLVLDFKNNNLKFTQIGSDGGFLPTPVVLDRLLIAPAERRDVIVDFSKLKPGQRVILRNDGPDSPFGELPIEGERANPATTGQVMEFRIVPPSAADLSVIPALPAFTSLGDPTNVRQVSLNELESTLVCVDRKNRYISGVTPPLCGGIGVPLAPLEARLGTVDAMGLGVPLAWEDAVTEDPGLNSTEIWEIDNFTEDAHPIHVHMVQFQVVDRTPFGATIGGSMTRGPEPGEAGFKDTVVALPGEITRIKAVYDIPGLFVWHCHIISHEDNEMMRPYCVGDAANCQP